MKVNINVNGITRSAEVEDRTLLVHFIRDDLDLTGLARASHGMTGADIKEVLRRVQLAKAMQDARTGGQVDPISQAELLASVREMLGGPRPRE